MLNWIDFNSTYYLDAIAAEYRARGRTIQLVPFVYAADFLPLAASATQIATVAIDQDADFALVQQAATANNAATLAVINNPNCTYEISADSTQRQYQNAPLHLSNGFGTGSRPHVLVKPELFPARTTISVKVTNLPATAINLRLSFIGCKIFSGGPG